jgi:hypothetical protein
MKKVLASITLCFYFAASCGVMINFHYCMDRYSSFKLYSVPDDKCDLCGMHTGNKGCCRDDVKIVKLQDDQHLSDIAFNYPDINRDILVPSQFIASSFYNIGTSTYFKDHPPPLLTEQDTYLQNCVFRI